MGISEMRWTGSGKMTSDGKTILYSGHEDTHIRGVGLILSKEAAQALIGWKPISERIITARFQSTHTKTTIVQAYAPTENAEECDKDAFYDQLQDTINEIPSHDVKLLIGDMNAQIGANRQGLEQVIGPHGTATQTNDNGDRLLAFCNINGLCIGNTYFAHKTIHKKTWKSPDGVTNNEIDYICINNRWKSSLSDVRVYCGADIGSDHHLLMATFHLRLKRQTQCKPIRPIAVEKLKDTTIANQFKIKLENRFELLQDATDIEDQWSGLKNTVIEVAEEAIGRRRGSQRERWIQDRTWQLIDERKITKNQREQARSKEEKENAAAKYQQLDDAIKRSCRSDKKAWIERKGEEAQEAAEKNDSKALYRIIRNLTGARSNSNAPIKDKNGKTLNNRKEQDERWVEHFQETLNQPNPTTTYDFGTYCQADELDVNTNVITVQEIQAAIKALKNNKAPGIDQITAELLKHGGNSLIQKMTVLLNQCWQQENVPGEWRKGVIVKLPKKGNITDCNNWRGITLLSVPGKVFCIVLLRRLIGTVDKILREEQAGFRHGRSCSEQIFTLRNIIEQCIEFQRPLFINFIDYRNVFDSVHRESLWHIARSYGIPQQYINIFKSLYANSSCCVRTDNGTTNFINIETGVRQGCILSPFLFLLVMDFVMKNAMGKPNTGIPWKQDTRLTDLDFADDMALLAAHVKKIAKK